MRPKIHAHFAMTADGKISTKNLTPSQFTSPADKARIGEIRARHDAILAGRGTVAADTMSMRLSSQNLRATRIKQGLPPEPLRVVISNAGKIDPAWKIFQHTGSPIVILSTTRLPQKLRATLAPLCDLHLYESPTVPLFGGAAAPTLTGLPGDFLPKPLEFRLAKMEVLNDECLLHFKRKKRQANI